MSYQSAGRQRQREDHDRSQRKAALHHERSEAKQHADFFSLVIHRQTWRSSSKAHSPPLTVQTSNNPARKQSGGQYLTSTSQEDEEEGQPGNHPSEVRRVQDRGCGVREGKRGTVNKADPRVQGQPGPHSES